MFGNEITLKELIREVVDSDVLVGNLSDSQLDLQVELMREHVIGFLADNYLSKSYLCGHCGQRVLSMVNHGHTVEGAALPDNVPINIINSQFVD